MKTANAAEARAIEVQALTIAGVAERDHLSVARVCSDLEMTDERVRKLAHALAYLGVTDIGNGRVAFQDHNTKPSCWYTTTMEGLLALVEYSDGKPPHMSPEGGYYYSNWLRLYAVEVKASWWLPERQFALLNAKGEIAATYPSRTTALDGWITGDRIITVDLATGEEVTA